MKSKKKIHVTAWWEEEGDSLEEKCKGLREM
jgi:hypothetical protein